MPFGPAAAAGAGCCTCLPLTAGGGARLGAYWLLNRLLYRPRPYDRTPSPSTASITIAEAPYVLEHVTYVLPPVSLYAKVASTPTGSNPFDGPAEKKSRILNRGESWQHALLLRPSEEGSAASLWVVFGGNGMLAREWLRFCKDLLEYSEAKGVAFLLIDYPAYGSNGGTPSPESVLKSSRQALDEALKQLGGDSAPQIHVLGHSLGAAAAAQFAASLTEKGMGGGHLILSAPFLSVPDMARHILNRMAAGPPIKSLPRPVFLLVQCMLGLALPHRWDNGRTVPKAAAAGWMVSILHGKRDQQIPIQMGRELHRLAEAACSTGVTKAEFIEAPAASHNDIIRVAFKDYAKAMGMRAADTEQNSNDEMPAEEAQNGQEHIPAEHSESDISRADRTTSGISRVERTESGISRSQSGISRSQTRDWI